MVQDKKSSEKNWFKNKGKKLKSCVQEQYKKYRLPYIHDKKVQNADKGKKTKESVEFKTKKVLQKEEFCSIKSAAAHRKMEHKINIRQSYGTWDKRFHRVKWKSAKKDTILINRKADPRKLTLWASKKLPWLGYLRYITL